MDPLGKWEGVNFPTHKRKRAQRKREVIRLRKLKQKQKKKPTSLKTN